MDTKNIREQWESGDLSAELALESLCRALTAIEDKLVPLDEMKTAVRADISEVVERSFNGKTNIEGFGQLKITDPAIIVTYNSQKIDRLIAQLVTEGYTEIAERIGQCATRTTRAGSLRIDRIRNF